MPHVQARPGVSVRGVAGPVPSPPAIPSTAHPHTSHRVGDLALVCRDVLGLAPKVLLPRKPLSPRQTRTVGHLYCRWPSQGFQAPPGAWTEAGRDPGAQPCQSFPRTPGPTPASTRPGRALCRGKQTATQARPAQPASAPGQRHPPLDASTSRTKGGRGCRQEGRAGSRPWKRAEWGGLGLQVDA